MITRRQFLAGAAVVVAAATGCRAPLLAPDRAELPAPAPGEPLRLALLSDTHTQSLTSHLAPTVNGKLMRALADLRPHKPDLWLCNGDITDHGYVAEHDAFLEIMAAVARPGRLLVTTGNHEFYDKNASDKEALSRFARAYGQERPYSSHTFGSVHLVMLGSEQWKQAPHDPDWAWISDEQLAWFDRTLAAHREKLTAVFLHQPLPGTVPGTVGEGDVAQAPELRAILEKHPQVRLWFSGHTHLPLEVEGQVSRQGKITYVALGSTFYLITPSGVDGGASQSRLMEIYPDRVVIKARDHGRRIWLPDAEVTVPMDEISL